jgi:small subunit ribosomal protein S1
MSEETKNVQENEEVKTPATETTNEAAPAAPAEETATAVAEESATIETATPAVEETTEFDWEEFESGNKGFTKEKFAQLEQMYADTLNSSVEHEVVTGKVVAMTDREAIIDINSKSEGVISLNEFRYNQDLKVGDDVEVLVDKQEDKNGQLVLSHRKARSIQAWDRVNGAF